MTKRSQQVFSTNFSPLDEGVYLSITIRDSSGRHLGSILKWHTSSIAHTTLIHSFRMNSPRLYYTKDLRVRSLSQHTLTVPRSSEMLGGESSGGISCKMEMRSIKILWQIEWKGQWSSLPEVVSKFGETFVRRT